MDNKMLKINSLFFTLLISSIIIFFNSCEQSTNVTNQPVLAPSRNLSAGEIMSAEGISSIHYVDYDSVIVNGTFKGEYSPFDEFYLDASHCKILQIFNGKYYNTTVYDLIKNIAWNYYNDSLTYLDLPNWPAAYENEIKADLGSWLKGPTKYLGEEMLNGKLCDVYVDSTGYKEWIWKEYKLPIQRRTEWSYDVYQISFTQKRDISINQKFPDSTFEPPK